MADPDYFTLAEFRDLADMNDEDTYPDVKVEAAAAYFTEIVEREVNASMIERTFTQTFDGDYRKHLSLAQPHVRTITSVTSDGVVIDVGTLSVNRAGTLRFLDGGTRWSNAGLDNVVVTYTAGKYEQCPADVKDAVMWATRDRVMSQASDNTQDPRQSSMTNDLGGTNQYVLPGENRPTGYPELDAVIASRRRGARPMVA